MKAVLSQSNIKVGKKFWKTIKVGGRWKKVVKVGSSSIKVNTSSIRNEVNPKG